MNNALVLGIVAIVIGALVFALSVSGAFWPATPVTDPGMLWTTVTFVLFGALGVLMGKRQAEHTE